MYCACQAGSLFFTCAPHLLSRVCPPYSSTLSFGGISGHRFRKTGGRHGYSGNSMHPFHFDPRGPTLGTIPPTIRYGFNSPTDLDATTQITAVVRVLPTWGHLLFHQSVLAHVVYPRIGRNRGKSPATEPPQIRYITPTRFLTISRGSPIPFIHWRIDTPVFFL